MQPHKKIQKNKKTKKQKNHTKSQNHNYKKVEWLAASEEHLKFALNVDVAEQFEELPVFAIDVPKEEDDDEEDEMTESEAELRKMAEKMGVDPDEVVADMKAKVYIYYIVS